MTPRPELITEENHFQLRPARCGEVVAWTLFDYAESTLQRLLEGETRSYVPANLDPRSSEWIGHYVSNRLRGMRCS